MPGEPELGEDHVGAEVGRAATDELAPVMADAAGELEAGAEFAAMRLDQREAGEIGRIAPAVGEIIADPAEAEQPHGVAQRQPVRLGDETREMVRLGCGAGPPVVLVGQQHSQSARAVVRVEPLQRQRDQRVTARPEEGDAVDHRPAVAPRGRGARAVRRGRAPRR